MKSKILAVYNAIEKIIKRLDDDKINIYAAQASFFVVISSVPLAMLFVTLLQYILPIERDALYQIVVDILPANNKIFSFIDNLLDEIFGRADLSIVSISAITLLWSSSRGLKSIARGIRNIYGNDEEFGIIKNTLFSFVYTIIFICILTLSIVLIFFGRFLQSYLDNKNTVILNIINALLDSQGLITFVVLVFVFALAYKGMARHEMKFKYQLIGAMFSALGWLIFLSLYTIYIDKFSNYSYIYGSLTAIILMMLWLYICMIILFMGAEINVWIYRKIKGSSNNKPYSW